MKKGIRILLFAAAIAVFALCTALVLSQVRAQRHLATCKGVKVHIEDGFRFVSEDDVKAYLLEGYGHYIGERIDSVNLARIESVLDSKSAVLRSEAWIGVDSTLHISITQREPVVRFQKGQQGFYADERGFLFPLQKDCSPLVQVVDGNIPLGTGAGFKGQCPTKAEQDWVAGIISLVQYMQKRGSWAEDIAQIHIAPGGDIVLVPREGRERFIFGAADDFPAKFSRMEKYYTHVKPSKPDGYYRSVNVKYRSQIICRQK